MGPESNTPLAVTVCGTTSLLFHTMRSPALTVRVAGRNFRTSMLMVWVAARAASGSAAASSSAERGNRRRRFMSLAQGGLQVLGVLQVRRDGGAHFHDQLLQFGVLGRGDQ